MNAPSHVVFACELEDFDNCDMLVEGDGALTEQRGRSKKRRKKWFASDISSSPLPVRDINLLYKSDQGNTMAVASSTDASATTNPAKRSKRDDAIDLDCKSPHTPSKQSASTRCTANVVTPETKKNKTPKNMISSTAMTSNALRSLSTSNEIDGTLSDDGVENLFRDVANRDTARQMTDADIFKIKSSREDFEFLTVQLQTWSLRYNEPGASMGLKGECLISIDPNWKLDHRLSFAKWVRTAFGRDVRVEGIHGRPCSVLKCSADTANWVLDRLLGQPTRQQLYTFSTHHNCTTASSAAKAKQNYKLAAKVKKKLSALSQTAKMRRVQQTDEKAVHLNLNSAYSIETLAKDFNQAKLKKNLKRRLSNDFLRSTEEEINGGGEWVVSGENENEGMEDDRVGATTPTRSYPTADESIEIVKIDVGNSTDEGNDVISRAFVVPGKDESGKVLEGEDGKKTNNDESNTYGIPGAKVVSVFEHEMVINGGENGREVGITGSMLKKGSGMTARVTRSSNSTPEEKSEDQSKHPDTNLSSVSNKLEQMLAANEKPKELVDRQQQKTRKLGNTRITTAPQDSLQSLRDRADHGTLRNTMTMQDLAVCREIHASMTSKKRRRNNHLFLEPVDTAEYPDYLTIVNRPMDLQTLMDNLDNGSYSTREEFYFDAKLIFNNAKLYNTGRAAFVVKMATSMTQALELLKRKAEKKAAEECADQRWVKPKSPGEDDDQRLAKPKDSGEDDSGAEKAILRKALLDAIVTEKPDVKWDDVAGLEGAKNSLKETVILPTRFPHWFAGKRRPFKGILLYGPPGTGKSYLAKAVASESDSTFFSVKSSDLISKWQGESERLVRNLFEMARESPGSRAIIFIDEVDWLCGSRSEGESGSERRIKSEFLNQMDSVGKNEGDILVLGATSMPWELDAAIRQRFEKRVYIPLPEAKVRSAMVKIHLGDTPNNLSDADFDTLGQKTVGASGADIKVLVKEALYKPIRRYSEAKQFLPRGEYLVPCEVYPNCPTCPVELPSDPPGTDYDCLTCGAKWMDLLDCPKEKLMDPVLGMMDFTSVLRHSHASVSEEEMEKYTKWTLQFGQDGA
jgi:vacuolar protein-sorting-associated protein 4